MGGVSGQSRTTAVTNTPLVSVAVTAQGGDERTALSDSGSFCLPALHSLESWSCGRAWLAVEGREEELGEGFPAVAVLAGG